MAIVDTQKSEPKINHDRRSKKYKKLLILTNAHLTDYQPGIDIQKTRESKFQYVISQLFPQNRRRGIESALLRRWVNINKMGTSRLYYDPYRVSDFSTLNKLRVAAKTKNDSLAREARRLQTSQTC